MARRKLTALTADMEALTPVVRDEWLRVGLATGPGDRAAAVAGVRLAYKEAGLVGPQVTVWLDSPFAGAIGAHLLSQVGDQVRDQVWDQVGDQVRDQVRDQVWSQVGAQVRDQVWDQVRDQVRDQVWSQVGDQVRYQVRDQVWSQVGDQVRDQIWSQVGDQVRDQVRDQIWSLPWPQVRGQTWPQVRGQIWDQIGRAIYGQHDAGWLSFHDYFGRIGIRGPERLAGLRQVAQNAGWWWPLTRAVILTARPASISLDDAGRLHSAAGPALAYPDGFAVYAWHGQRMPVDVVETHAAGKLTADHIHRIDNAEQRRCAIEMLGYDRYIREAGAKKLAADEYGTLWTIPGYDPELRLVEVVNSSVHDDGNEPRYLIPVDPDDPRCRTPVGAVAWTFDTDPDTYRRMAVQA